MKEKRNGKITKNDRFMERLLTALLVLILGMTVSAAEGVSGRGFRIPDDNFRVFCIEKGYADADGYIIPVKAASVTTLDVSRKRISSLEGIGYFTGLTELYCNDNSLKKLEVSECKVLTYLNCSSNRMTMLDVSGCKALIKLDCKHNDLGALDLKELADLKDLNCYNNELDTLDIVGCKALIELDCRSNRLKALEIKECRGLIGLYCSNNPLQMLDVTECTVLTCLNCENNDLKTLDVSKCKELTQLVCHYNRLKVLDVSEVLKTAVYILYCGNQQDEQGNSRTLTLTLTRRQELLWKKMLADEYKANTFNAKVNLNVKHI